MIKANLSTFDETIHNLITRDEPTGAVVFYGSSTIAIWGHERLKAQMHDIPAVNRGFGGSTAEQALYYYQDAVRPLCPRALVWYEGDNDMPIGYTAEDTFFLSERVFAWAKKDFPDIKIFIIPTKSCPARASVLEKYAVYRSLLKEYADSTDNVFYIDYIANLYKDGIIFDGIDDIRRELFMDDMLHFNDKGYEELSAVVYKVLKENL